ncbi:hypothetical protein PT974_11335 [Cladobotryum mycophilum]|uniref:F-box domain-containing protein n=1 Tax=Cladobotryum mycophilum TaxID=491253 RepID=A0ABR0S5X5_9HYPO
MEQPRSQIYFPPEILLLIFRHLGPGRKPLLCSPDLELQGLQEAADDGLEPGAPDTGTLYSLCLVSRRVRDLAQPFLYREFTMGGKHLRFYCFWAMAYRSDPKWSGRLVQFVRTLIEHRDLARLVKRVRISEEIFVHAGRTESILAVLKQAVTHVFPSSSWTPERSQEMSGTQSEGEHRLWCMRRTLSDQNFHMFLKSELVACLIALLPNLEHLRLCDGFRQSYLEHDEIPFFWKAAKMKSLPLRTLDLGTGLERMVPVMSMALHLETLNLHACESIFPFADGPRVTFPNLKTLLLTDSMFNHDEVRRLLNCCTGGLHKFAYEVNWRFPASDIMQSLSRHHKTLKYLHLDHCKSASMPRLTGFEKCTALSSLFLGSMFLSDMFASDSLHEIALPPFLESLRLSSYSFRGPEENTALCQFLAHLLEVKTLMPVRYPNLRYVTCDKRRLLAEEVSGVGAALGAVGITLIGKG